MSALWRAPAPLTLASGSAARRMLLENAGIPLELLKAPVNEGEIAAQLIADRAQPQDIAAKLAEAKAREAARLAPGALILTADQTLDLDGQLFSKPPNRAAARTQLEALSGQTHQLHSAAVLVLGNRRLWAGTTSASLSMRELSPAFLETYLDFMGEDVTTTVGGYKLEGLGIQLFERVEGDHATILGLPLLPLLAALRDAGYLAA
jgi:septum formation protein